jgi:hypothetical protein
MPATSDAEEYITRSFVDSDLSNMFQRSRLLGDCMIEARRPFVKVLIDLPREAGPVHEA